MFKNLKKKKRILALLIAVAMVLVPLAAYGSQYDNYEPLDGAYEAGYTTPTPELTGGYEAIVGASGEYQNFAPFTTTYVSDLAGLLGVIASPGTTTEIVLTQRIEIPAGPPVTITTSIPLRALEGGFYISTGAILYLENVTLTSSDALNGTFHTGVRVEAGGAFTMNNGAVISGFRNRGAIIQGGGSTFTLNGGAISDNSNHGGHFQSGWGGGGVLVNGQGGNAVFIMNGGTISGNDNFQGGQGGGVAIVNGASFTLTGSGRIENNTAHGGMMGGGVHINTTQPFIMSGGYIIGNQAGRGGGVSLMGSSQFEMSNGTISGNTAGEGGGVLVDGAAGGSVFNMSGGTISDGNNAQRGGGVWVGGAEFNMSGTSVISNNQAAYGGGIFLFRNILDITGGTISNNDASAHGAGIFISGPGHGVDASISGANISGNTAIGNGGGIGLGAPLIPLSIVGNTTITSNTAANGGGIGFVRDAAADYDATPDELVASFRAFLQNVEIADTVVFRNTAIEGERVNRLLHEQVGYSVGIDATCPTNRFGVGGFTNFNIHTPPIKELIVIKEWRGITEANRPTEIRVQLFRGETPMGILTLNAANGWEVNFGILPTHDSDGNIINYTVRVVGMIPTEVPDLTIGSPTTPVKANTGEWIVTIGSIFSPYVGGGVLQFEIIKEWYGDGNHLNHRPEYITVEIRRPNHDAYVAIHQIRPNANNVWTLTGSLPARDAAGAPLIEYYVVERNVPAGYRSRVDIARNTVTGNFTATITNTFTPPGEDPQDRRRTDIRRGPLTGDLASVAPLFAGLLFASSAVLGGTSLRKKFKDLF